MNLEKLGELSIALAICVVILLIIRALVPVMIRKKDANGHDNSGAKPVEFWERTIDQSVRSAVGQAFVGRNEELRRNITEPIIQALEKKDEHLIAELRSLIRKR